MKKSSKKTILALVLILGGVGFLILKGISDTGVYYRTVAEVLASNPPPQLAQKVRQELTRLKAASSAQ